MNNVRMYNTYTRDVYNSRLRQIEQACADPNDNDNEEESGARRVQETDPEDEERICEQV